MSQRVARAVILALTVAIATANSIAEDGAKPTDGEEPCDEGEIVGGVLGAPPAEGTPPVTVNGSVVAPRLVTKFPPHYPEKMSEAKLQAKVFLQAVIEKDGSVGCLKVLSSGVRKKGKEKADPRLQIHAPAFEAEAKNAVRQWRYEPATRDGAPVRVYFTLFIDFKL